MAPNVASKQDLPMPLVEQITRLARGRWIPGTNRYAQVCRQWREAGRSIEPDPLQLFLDQRWVDDADLSRLSSWMSMHGQHVGTLVFEGSLEEAMPLDWFLAPAAAFSSLLHLEVAQQESLALLVPVLNLLPQLQHLAAHVGLALLYRPYSGGKGVFCGSVPLKGTFCVGGRNMEEVPALEELCPQLLHLQLTLQHECDCIFVDSRLHELLPRGLQQLTLINADVGPYYSPVRVWLGRSALQLEQHPALQQLVLRDVRVAEGEKWDLLGRGEVSHEWGEFDRGGDGEELYECVPVQLQLHLTHTAQRDEADLEELAPLLTGLQVPSLADVLCLSSCTQLTRLILSEGLWGGRPDISIDALAALTGLQELDLQNCGRSLAAAVQQAAGMPTLRSLSVKGEIPDPAGFSSSLAKCTQLTSLGLLVPLPVADLARALSCSAEHADGDADEYEDEGEWYEGSDDPEVAAGEPAMAADAPVAAAVSLQLWVHSLQGLTGLRCLSVPALLLGWEAGSWLAPLTRLSRLCGSLPHHCPYEEPIEEPVHKGGKSICGLSKPTAAYVEPPVRDGEWVQQHMQDKVSTLLGQVQEWPASLQYVLLSMAPLQPQGGSDQEDVVEWRHIPVRPRCWEHTPAAGPSRAPLKVWLDQPGYAAKGWPRHLRPCPHLPGVWELQEPGVSS